MLSSPAGTRNARVLSRRRLSDRRAGRQDFRGIARARRVDALAIDRALGLLRRFSGRGDPAVPALAIDSAPRAEIEAGHVIADVERDRRLADQVADDVVPGDASHRAG